LYIATAAYRVVLTSFSVLRHSLGDRKACKKYCDDIYH